MRCALSLLLATSAALSLLLPGTAPAQQQRSPAINLGTLKNTVVDASSVNGSRSLDNRFYGVRNLFDGGENLIQGINYTYWLSDHASRHWLKMTLEAPMQAQSIMLEFNASARRRNAIPGALAESDSPNTLSAVERRPQEFALDVTTIENGHAVTKKLPSIPVKGFRTFYPLDVPIDNVVELLIVFPGPSIVEVAELEVLGLPSTPVEGMGEGPKLASEGEE